MNEETQRKINEGLALAMGWQEFPYLVTSLEHPEGRRVFCPPGTKVHISTTERAPDYFAASPDAHQAKADLLAWLCDRYGQEANEDEQRCFVYQMAGMVNKLARVADPSKPGLYRDLRLLAATPAQVAIAAAVALGKVTVEEVAQ